MQERVGASIVEIITESLYDKPIVVFREYVQNAADSLREAECNCPAQMLAIRIWKSGETLFFLDNGTGIKPNDFFDRMGTIANSAKSRSKNIGYKGIGRLSGLSYCNKLQFINIADYKNKVFQTYEIDCLKYMDLRRAGELSDLPFSSLMERISRYDANPPVLPIETIIGANKELFEDRNTGFLVVLNDITPVLRNAIQDKKFKEDLEWLLPVPFHEELRTPLDSDCSHELFEDLEQQPAFKNDFSAPAKSFDIQYNGCSLKRPIIRNRIRDYLCKSNLGEYAVCVHTFSNAGIAINNRNPFSGIRMYIDNILLCDETELIPALQQFNILSRTSNEAIQSVRGIGAVIYITDKINISANARRTFIDVTDEDSITFLKLIGEFVENIIQARYAMSKYYSAQKKELQEYEQLQDLKGKAEEALVKLAQQEVVLEDQSIQSSDFSELKPNEQRQIIKAKITKSMNERIKRYIEEEQNFDPENCIDNFISWLLRHEP